MIPLSDKIILPLESEDFFLGREFEMNRFKNLLFSTSSFNTSSVFLYGDVGIGKTSFLSHFVSNSEDKDFFIVYLDLDFLSIINRGTSQLFAVICDEICTSLNFTFSANLEFLTSPFIAFSNFLKSLSAFCRDKKLILLFDNFFVLKDLVLSGKIEVKSVIYLLNSLRSFNGISFVLVGFYSLYKWCFKYLEIVVSDLSFFSLGCLDYKSSSDFMLAVIEFLPKFCVDKIYDLTSGHPYLVNLYLTDLRFIFLNRSYRLNFCCVNAFTLEDIDSITSDILLYYCYSYFENIWRWISSQGDYYIFVVRLLLSYSQGLSLGGILRYFPDTLDVLVDVLDELVLFNVVKFEYENYCISIPLFNSWISLLDI